jgi:hypothetical protein
MNKIAQFAAVALVGVIAGFAGGTLAASLVARRVSIQQPPVIIRAKQFEAIGEKGVVRARFGLDRGDVPVMSFLGPDEKERFSIILDNVDEPVMMMKDTPGNTRVVFGHETSDTASPADDDWSLSFSAPNEDYFSAEVGVKRSYRSAPFRKSRGVVKVRDAQGNWHSVGPE